MGVGVANTCGHEGSGATWFTVKGDEYLALCSHCHAVVTKKWHDELRAVRAALAESAEIGKVHLNEIARLQSVVAESEQTIGALKHRLGEMEDARCEISDELDERRRFMSLEGYRECDIAACNCGSWHGGNASNRLREISDLLEDRTQGVTILNAIAEIIENEEVLERENGELRADLVWAIDMKVTAWINREGTRRFVEWEGHEHLDFADGGQVEVDGTDTDLCRAIREARRGG